MQLSAAVIAILMGTSYVNVNSMGPGALLHSTSQMTRAPASSPTDWTPEVNGRRQIKEMQPKATLCLHSSELVIFSEMPVGHILE